MAMYGTKLPYQVIQIDDEDKHHVPKGVGLQQDELARFISEARAGGARHVFNMDPLPTIQTIDPATGDSLLHIAIQSGSRENIQTLLDGLLYPMRGKQRWYEWAYHAMLVHQNHQGDTMLHFAARLGDKLILVMLYRHIFVHWSASCPEITIMDDGPPETGMYPEELDDWYCEPAFLLLVTKNKSGRDPAEEARHAANDDLAQWLDDVTWKLDHDGERRTEASIAQITKSVAESNWHDWIAEKGGSHTYRNGGNPDDEARV